MAVYTEVADDELAEFIATYDVGELLSFKGIAEGVENSNYLVRTDRAEFILTLYEKRVRREDLPFFLGLMEHLAERGIACPTPVHDLNGNTLRELADRPCALITFLSGLWVRRPQPHHCAEVGKALGNMHTAALDYPQTRKNALCVSDWRGLFELSASHANTVAEGLAQEVEAELTEIEKAWPDGLPVGTIHADLFPDNVFFL
ncbi:MAG: phosphotransferase, partial [Gammaproteobacteria bacterium]|nr:phosphotransferase [Gammaproteobacteria bacterium]